MLDSSTEKGKMDSDLSLSEMLRRSIETVQSPNSLHLMKDSGFSDVQSVFVLNDLRSDDYSYEITVYKPSIIVCKRQSWENKEAMVVIVNVDEKKLLGVYRTCNGKANQLLEQIQWGVIDLTLDGCRWEGDCQDNQPFGWGRFYNAENYVRYEGFRIGSDDVCYGTYYFSDNPRMIPEYKGELVFNQRHGRGALFNRNGKLEYQGVFHQGEMVKDVSVVSPSGTQGHLRSHTFMRECIIESNCYNKNSLFCLSVMYELTTLRVGENCFNTTRHPTTLFQLQNCPKLRTIEIGKNSFTHFQRFELKRTIPGMAFPYS